MVTRTRIAFRSSQPTSWQTTLRLWSRVPSVADWLGGQAQRRPSRRAATRRGETGRGRVIWGMYELRWDEAVLKGCSGMREVDACERIAMQTRTWEAASSAACVV